TFPVDPRGAGRRCTRLGQVAGTDVPCPRRFYPAHLLYRWCGRGATPPPPGGCFPPFLVGGTSPPTTGPPPPLGGGGGAVGVVWVACSAERANSGGLRALGALADLEFDLLVLLEGAEARTLDLGVVDEDVSGAVLGRDEAEPLLRVEPLHSSLCHSVPSLS